MEVRLRQARHDEPVLREVAIGDNRLAYIGQDLYQAGVALGKRIVSMVDGGAVVGVIATPGQLNIQPRLDGAAAAIKASGKSITFEQITTGPTVNEEVRRVDSYYTGHTGLKGMFAAMAAAVIGGTLLTGGSGTVIGALFGAVVLGILMDGFALLGVSAYAFEMIPGAAILVTMAINVRLCIWRDQGG